jgi:hypothetical protein
MCLEVGQGDQSICGIVMVAGALCQRIKADCASAACQAGCRIRKGTGMPRFSHRDGNRQRTQASPRTVPTRRSINLVQMRTIQWHLIYSLFIRCPSPPSLPPRHPHPIPCRSLPATVPKERHSARQCRVPSFPLLGEARSGAPHYGKVLERRKPKVVYRTDGVPPVRVAERHRMA